MGQPVAPGYDSRFPPARDDRRAGVIMHPTSLPGPYGIGDAGPQARAFVDWLAKGKMRVWQVLPRHDRDDRSPAHGGLLVAVASGRDALWERVDNITG